MTGPPTADITSSPLYLLAVLYSSRRSGDVALERVTAEKLDAMGVRVSFDNRATLAPTKQAKKRRPRDAALAG
jgi:hypothetical protein